MTVDPALLTGPATADLRQTARQQVDAGGGDVGLLLRAFPGTDRELARQVLLQETLRLQARAKLGPIADRMCFTRQGLEQATQPVVAARRARLLREADMQTFSDLGCGLGVDSMAAARAGFDVMAVERDEVTAAFARHNIRSAAPDARVEVIVDDAVSILSEDGIDPPGWAADDAHAVWFADPSRRAGHRPDGTARRSLRPDDWQPPWQWVIALADRHPSVVAKAAPGIPHEALPLDAAVEWVSVSGQLAEATIWFSNLARSRPARSAVLLTPGPDPWTTAAERVLSGSSMQRDAGDGSLGGWLLEPDPAVIRAHLIAELCDRVGGRLISPGIAYVTVDEQPEAGYGRVDRVVAVLPAKPKRLREELQRRGVGSAEIRTRGLALQPERLRRELRLPGGGLPAHLVLTRVRGRAAAVLVEP